MRAHLAASMFVTMWVLYYLLSVVSAAPRPIEINVSPRLAFAPANLSIQVRVHPDPSDRYITVRTDGGDFARSSSWSIEPDRVLYRVNWTAVPAGEYDIQALIGHGEIISGSDRVSVQLMGAEQ